MMCSQDKVIWRESKLFCKCAEHRAEMGVDRRYSGGIEGVQDN